MRLLTYDDKANHRLAEIYKRCQEWGLVSKSYHTPHSLYLLPCKITIGNISTQDTKLNPLPCKITIGNISTQDTKLYPLPCKITIGNISTQDTKPELHLTNMAGVTSLLEKMTIANNTTDDAATGTQSPLLFLLPEVFQEILRFTPQTDRVSLSQTCRTFRYSPEVDRALLAEPLSPSYLPMTYGQSPDSKEVFEEKESVWGYTDDLDENLERRVNGSDKGPYSEQTRKYLTARQYYHYCSKINETNGRSVRKLAISNFLTIENVQQFAKFCPNIRHLDLASLMPPVDFVPEGRILDSKKISWEGLTTKCTGIFANVRSIRLAYSADECTFGRGGLTRLAMLLRQAPQLQCLELCFKGPYPEGSASGRFLDRWLCFGAPQLASTLIEALAANASQRLTELRLDSMLVVVRNLRLFVEKLRERLPNLTKVGTTINKDLQALGWEIYNVYPRIAYMNAFESNLFHLTPTTCGTYLHMIKDLAEDPRWELTSLDSEEVHALRPATLFACDVELFQALKEKCNWAPTFDWHEQMNGRFCTVIRRRTQPLHRKIEYAREEEISWIRELFGNIKEAGIPVQLLLSTRDNDPRHSSIDPDHGVRFTKTASDAASDLKGKDNIFKYYSRYNPERSTTNSGWSTFNPDEEVGDSSWTLYETNTYLVFEHFTPWYLERIEDLVDQFMVFDPAEDILTPNADVILLDKAFVLDRASDKVGIKAPETKEKAKKTKKPRPTNKRHMGRYRALQSSDD